MAVKRTSENTKSLNVFGQARRVAKMFRPDLYGRIAEAVEIMQASKQSGTLRHRSFAYLEMTGDHR